ncbi:hypothetical protein N0V84_002410 [Fusarium piperis]|uniref:FAD-binding PCMH-type domain-containing protein n=1 Tax=Fusarium piperis TaxID=1435070 RepID=A0A9W8WJM1_9HYPO|nr:hypothetical protein N0V84_002410 [Fusarium piperis]
MAASLSGLDSVKHLAASTERPSRWSDTKIEQPALILIPRTEQDVQAALSFAKTNTLSVVASGGGHGAFVTVGPKTLYLDMKEFKTIELNKEKGTVRVGGGVVTGELSKTLAKKGYYTPLPNSNAVGVVGCVIGGGNTPLNGLHGWMADIVVSFRAVTAGGDIIEVSSSSTGKELTLFNALCGAGHGISVITSIETSVYPIADLNMAEDKVWTRSLVFPVSAIDTAAQLFLDLLRPPPAASITLLGMRSPPGTPAAGVPIIVLGYSYFGPAEEAEKHAALLFQEDMVSKAIMANTVFVPMENINDKLDPLNTHGGYKSIASCRLEKTNIEAIKNAFQQWLSVTTKYPDSQKSPLALSSHNGTKLTELGQENPGSAKFVESRDRGISAQIVTICKKEETMAALTEFMDDTIAELRKGDPGSVPRSFPNNLRFGINLEEMFDKERLAELREIKKLWDADGLFWSPFKV